LIEKGRKRREQIEGEGERKGGRMVVGGEKRKGKRKRREDRKEGERKKVKRKRMLIISTWI